MTIKQTTCGIALALILLFSGYAAIGIYDTYDQTSEIPTLIARVKKLEDKVIDLQVTQGTNQRDIVETIQELKITVDLLTRITAKNAGLKPGAMTDD